MQCFLHTQYVAKVISPRKIFATACYLNAIGLIAVGLSCSCKSPAASSEAETSTSSSLPSSGIAAPPTPSAEPPTPPPREVTVDELEVSDDLPAFIVRGKEHGERMVFLHGLCGNPYAYALSFHHAAARFGTMIALQGNKSCGPDFRDWSSTPAQVDERIEAAFRAAGDTSELQDLIVIGYSSGGTFAELLVLRNPKRYTRAILIANPREPTLHRLRSVRAAVMMAGDRDRHDLMKAGRRTLTSKGIPTTFLILPGATHGEMGHDAERVMGQAIEWLLDNQLPLDP